MNIHALIVVSTLLMSGEASAADFQPRVTIKPATPVAAKLLHGLTLRAQDDEFPVLIKVSGVEAPFVGKAHLQSGRAIIRVVEYSAVQVEGYVVSPVDKKSGLGVTCLKSREISSHSECVYGEISKGDKVNVIFPGGIDIAQWKK